MNVKKILKFYLVLTIAMTGFVSVSQSDLVKSNFPAYSGFFHNAGKSIFGADAKNENSKSFASVINLDVFLHDGQGLSLNESIKQNFSLEVLNDAKKAFAKPGDLNVLIMEYRFKTADSALDLKSLKLKIYGVDASKIKNLRVFDEKQNMISNGKFNGKYIIFSKLDFSVDKNSEKKLIFKVDLSDDLNPGDRLKFDIEKSEDLVMNLEGKNVKFDGPYPVKGKYISIAVARASKAANK